MEMVYQQVYLVLEFIKWLFLAYRLYLISASHQLQFWEAFAYLFEVLIINAKELYQVYRLYRYDYFSQFVGCLNALYILFNDGNGGKVWINIHCFCHLFQKFYLKGINLFNFDAPKIGCK